ncbi:MAG: pyruvate, phosphate dikinase [Myxococcota bacterium]
MSSEGRRVYLFGAGRADGSAAMKALLGGKGAGLAEMTNLGIPVPPGFTITTEVCREFYEKGQAPEGLQGEIAVAMRRVEEIAGARFGDPDAPLLVSVRSGARASMPGMMDTILNLGLTSRTVLGLARRTANPRFAWDSYRRFIEMYAEVVLGVRRHDLEELLEARKKARGAASEHDLDADDLRQLCGELTALARANRAGADFPDDPDAQLWGAIQAVFRSWMNPRAIAYRRMYGIPESWGTAVTVQAMVFGNMGRDCATGVVFTRDPNTGERVIFGEYLVDAQGEDVVAGARTPEPISAMQRTLPDAHGELVAVCERLERHYRDAQDIEFTVQQGRLWLLQTRAGKRTARAMVKIAVDLVHEGTIGEDEAVLRLDPDKVDELLHPEVDPCPESEAIAHGLAASPGAAVGRIVFTSEEAQAWAERGEKVVLVRTETSPDDVSGMRVAQGILTARGGLTSHAAVVARGMGKCCVVGAGGVMVDYARQELRTGDVTLRRGDTLTLCGTHGLVFQGAREVRPPRLPDEYETAMAWADARRRLRVRTNADEPDDAARARAFGAEGIGLCRTEHMFFKPDRVGAVREMLLADDEVGRRAALAKIFPMQKGDFAGIFRAMDGLPVTIRLLDPPLHEFLPARREECDEIARETGLDAARLWRKAEALREVNPMLGHRGCRLGMTYPEIYETQVRAIVEAACEVAAGGGHVEPEIMIPLVGHEEELRRMRALCERVAFDVLAERGASLPIAIGTMIELPRACVVADRIAAHADFFSFGTNDLTQTVFGLSRDDAGRFLPFYVEQGLFTQDPFVAIDRDGLGPLLRMAIEKGRAAKPGLKIGICGEHGGEPSSVEFCHQLGLDYVSCSPFRVPIARLAAAQAALREKRGPA